VLRQDARLREGCHGAEQRGRAQECARPQHNSDRERFPTLARRERVDHGTFRGIMTHISFASPLDMNVIRSNFGGAQPGRSATLGRAECPNPSGNLVPS
jgi:hypothetical protein